MTKMTKKEMLANVIAVVNDSTAENKDTLIDMLKHEIDLINKKASSKKPTARQLENERFKADILAYLTECDTAKTIKELCVEVPSFPEEITPQRVTHMMTALVTEGRVNKDYVKKTPYFSISA